MADESSRSRPIGRQAAPPVADDDKTPRRERLDTCPETGRSLDGLDLWAWIDHLWPRLDEQDPRYEEARRRRALLVAEARARQAEK